MTLEWRGEEIVQAIERAAGRSAERVVDRAIEFVEANTPVDTGRARDSVRRESGGLAIVWGYHVGYGIFIEVGEQGRTGHHALRRAADLYYPTLAPAIAADWHGGLGPIT